MLLTVVSIFVLAGGINAIPVPQVEPAPTYSSTTVGKSIFDLIDNVNEVDPLTITFKRDNEIADSLLTLLADGTIDPLSITFKRDAVSGDLLLELLPEDVVDPLTITFKRETLYVDLTELLGGVTIDPLIICQLNTFSGPLPVRC